MHFGLMDLLATLQRMMNNCLEGIPFARAYIDDVVMFQILKTLDKHISDVKTVSERI